MDNLFSPVPNMTCYLEPTGNAARHWNGTPIIGTVTEVNRRNFLVKIDSHGSVISIRKSSCVCKDINANSGYIAFGSLDAFNREQKRKLLHKAFCVGYSKSFSGSRLSYEALAQICDIMVAEGFLTADQIPEK